MIGQSSKCSDMIGQSSKCSDMIGQSLWRRPCQQLGFKVGVEHETVVLSKGKDGSDEYKAGLLGWHSSNGFRV
jgi:hypothetical protein